MKILVSGSTGLIGSALVPFLTSGGHSVVRFWDTAAGSIDSSALEGLDAVVHLAGENIAARRWTPAQKARIRDSRVQGTRLLAQSLARSRPQ